MVTRMVRAVTGTLAIAGVLAGCASTLHTTGTVDVDGADVWVTE